MGTKFYNDEVIATNFSNLSNFNGEVIEVLDTLVTVAERQEARLKALENIQLVVKLPKRHTFLTLAAGAALGIYVYRNRQKFKNVSTDKIVDGIEHVIYGDDEKTKPGKPTNDQKN